MEHVVAADYYGVLGVRENAPAEEIRKAFRTLAFKLHPDRNPGRQAEHEELFKQLVEAYDVLSDSSKRRQYDMQRRVHQHHSADSSDLCDDFFSQFCASPEETSAFEQVLDSFFATDLVADKGDLFGNFQDMATFFGTPARSKPEEEVQEVPLPVTLEELYSGCVKVVPVKRRMVGLGSCRSRAAVATYRIQVKPGWKEGTRVTFSGSESGSCQGEGAVCFVVKQEPHAHFLRKGDDLHATVQVPLLTALIGGTVTVPKLDGRHLDVSVAGVPTVGRFAGGSGGVGKFGGLSTASLGAGPPDRRGKGQGFAWDMRNSGGVHWGGGSGDTGDSLWERGVEHVVVKGEGMPVSKRPGAKGDLHLELVVGMPEVLSEQQKQMLRQLLG